MGAFRECQVVPGTTPTALLAGTGTTKVGIHTARTTHTAHREPVSSNPDFVATATLTVTWGGEEKTFFEVLVRA